MPTIDPTIEPTKKPTVEPTMEPTTVPTLLPRIASNGKTRPELDSCAVMAVFAAIFGFCV